MKRCWAVVRILSDVVSREMPKNGSESALFHIGLRLTGLSEWKALVHMGAHPAIRNALQQDLHPSGDHARLVPHMAEVHAEGGFVSDERHAFSLGEPLQFDRPVFRAVVDGFVQAALFQEVVLAAACRAIDRCA